MTAQQHATTSVGCSQRPCIAILLGAPLNAQNRERIGIPYLSPYADIVVLDCKPWLGRSDTGLHHEEAKWDVVEPISSSNELDQALRRYRPQYALDFIGLGPLTPGIQRLLVEAGVRFVVQKSGNLPLPSLFARISWRLRLKFRGRPSSMARPPASTSASADSHGIPAGVLRRLGRRLARAWKMRRELLAPDVALLAGSASLTPFTKRARQILWTASQDYHLYRSAQPGAFMDLADTGFVVFVDDYLPYASDWTVLGLPVPVTAERYYSEMSRFFDDVEKQWGVPVIIAAHPSARHDHRVSDGFGDRKVIHGRTAELVRQAQVVLLHASTAVSFAVLDNKPLLFLTTDELQRSPLGLGIQTMARELGLRPLNIKCHARLGKMAAFLTFHANSYQRYISRYICREGSNEAEPWAGFIHLISSDALEK